MKLLIGDGRRLAAWDVTGDRPVVLLRARPGGPPIKFNDARLVDDEEARAILRAILATGWYDNVR
jgi:hypothetical protein